MHIPKTAGSAFRTLLLQLYSIEELFPVDYRSFGITPDEFFLDRYKLYIGLIYFDQLKKIPGEFRVVTFLREPISRLLSHYVYWKSMKIEVIEYFAKCAYDGSRFAKQLDLADFLKADNFDVQLQCDNCITKCLIGLDYVDAKGKLVIEDDMAFEIAKNNLNKMTAFGIQEKYEDSVRVMFNKLELDLPSGYEFKKDNDYESLIKNEPSFENNKIDLSPLNDEEEEIVNYMTRIDRRVYQYALDGFEAQ